MLKLNIITYQENCQIIKKKNDEQKPKQIYIFRLNLLKYIKEKRFYQRMSDI